MPVQGGDSSGVSIVDTVEIWKRAALEHARRFELRRGPSGARRFHVDVSLGFLLFAMLQQILALRLSYPGGYATLPALFLALFLYELPRALVARRHGRASRIILSAKGSQTEIVGAPLGRFAEIASSGVGSLANGCCAAAAALLSRSVSAAWAAPLQVIAGCQAAWGLAQLLPITPFRAGMAISQRLGSAVRAVHAGLSLAVLLVASIWVSGAAWAFTCAPVVFLASVACWRHLCETTRAGNDERSGAARLADEADAAVRRDEPARAIELAERASVLATSPELQRRLAKTIAWAAIAKPDPLLAHRAMERLPARELDLHLVAAYLSCCNRLEEAAHLLEKARAHGHRAPETTKLLIDVLARSGKGTAALVLAATESASLSAAERQAVVDAVG